MSVHDVLRLWWVLPTGLALVLSGYFVVSVSRRRVLREAPVA